MGNTFCLSVQLKNTGGNLGEREMVAAALIQSTHDQTSTQNLPLFNSTGNPLQVIYFQFKVKLHLM